MGGRVYVQMMGFYHAVWQNFLTNKLKANKNNEHREGIIYQLDVCEME